MNGDNVRVSANVPRTAGCDGDGSVSPTNYSPPYYHIPLYQYYTTTTPYQLLERVLLKRLESEDVEEVDMMNHAQAQSGRTPRCRGTDAVG